MGFAEAEAAECVQELSLAPEDLTSNSLTMLNFLKFQGVLSVQVNMSLGTNPKLKLSVALNIA